VNVHWGGRNIRERRVRWEGEGEGLCVCAYMQAGKGEDECFQAWNWQKRSKDHLVLHTGCMHAIFCRNLCHQPRRCASEQVGWLLGAICKGLYNKFPLLAGSTRKEGGTLGMQAPECLPPTRIIGNEIYRRKILDCADELLLRYR